MDHFRSWWGLADLRFGAGWSEALRGRRPSVYGAAEVGPKTHASPSLAGRST
jgi:hypothetical protein